MRPVLLMAPLLVAACTGSWPTTPYVQIGSDSDPMVLAPAVTECIAEVVPPKSVVALPSSDTPLSAVLADDLTRNGLLVQPTGAAISYVIAPVDTGEFIRITAPHGICSQYLARVSGTLRPAGPLMVMSK